MRRRAACRRSRGAVRVRIDGLGAQAIWITAALGVGSLALLFLLKAQPQAGGAATAQTTRS